MEAPWQVSGSVGPPPRLIAKGGEEPVRPCQFPTIHHAPAVDHPRRSLKAQFDQLPRSFQPHSTIQPVSFQSGFYQLLASFLSASSQLLPAACQPPVSSPKAHLLNDPPWPPLAVPPPASRVPLVRQLHVFIPCENVLGGLQLHCWRRGEERRNAGARATKRKDDEQAVAESKEDVEEKLNACRHHEESQLSHSLIKPRLKLQQEHCRLCLDNGQMIASFRKKNMGTYNNDAGMCEGPGHAGAC